MRRLGVFLGGILLAIGTTARAGELDDEFGTRGKTTPATPLAVAPASPGTELDRESPTQACFFGRRFFGFGGFGYGFPRYGYGFGRFGYGFGYPGFGFGGFGFGYPFGFGGFGFGRGFGGFGYGRGFGGFGFHRGRW